MKVCRDWNILEYFGAFLHQIGVKSEAKWCKDFDADVVLYAVSEYEDWISGKRMEA